MNEDLLTLICLIIGLIAGAPLGYLLGRYRITIKRVEVEDEESDQETKATFKRKRMD
jgi:membrane protein DedA with SNARE-associated domain